MCQSLRNNAQCADADTNKRQENQPTPLSVFHWLHLTFHFCSCRSAASAVGRCRLAPVELLRFSCDLRALQRLLPHCVWLSATHCRCSDILQQSVRCSTVSAPLNLRNLRTAIIIWLAFADKHPYGHTRAHNKTAAKGFTIACTVFHFVSLTLYLSSMHRYTDVQSIEPFSIVLISEKRCFAVCDSAARETTTCLH